MSSYRIFPSTNGVVSPQIYAGNFIAGVQFCVTAEAWFEGYWWWVCSTSQSTASVKCALWLVPVNSSTPVLVPNSTVTSGTLTAGQWNFVPLPTPIPLSLGGSPGMAPPISAPGAAVYCAAIGVNGNFPDTNNFWGNTQPGGNGITNGILTAYSSDSGNMTRPPGGYQGGQGCFSTGGPDPTTTFPGGTSNTDNFWVDVQVADKTAMPAGSSLRLWPDTEGIVYQPNGDNTVAVSGTAFTLSQSCMLEKIWMNNPVGSTGLATRVGIWDIASKTEVAGTDNASPTWEQPRTWFMQAGATLQPDPTTSTIGNEFYVTTSAPLNAIWFYSAPGAVAALPSACAIYTVSNGQVLAGTLNSSPTWTNTYGKAASPGDGWVRSAVSGSVTLAASTNYIVAVQGGDNTNNWHSDQNAALPVQNSILFFTEAFLQGSTSITYPGNSGSNSTTAVFALDVEVVVQNQTGLGWIYVDYSGSNIILPAGNYITSYYNGNGKFIYSDYHNYFFSGTDPKGGGTVGGAGWQGISWGGGILTAPNLANGPSLIYDDNSGTFPGQTAYLPGNTAWGYPSHFEASSDWGETRWADVEVTPVNTNVNTNLMSFFP